MATKPRKKEQCPQCYLDGKPDVELEVRPGSVPRCPGGHQFPDTEELAALMMKVIDMTRPPEKPVSSDASEKRYEPIVIDDINFVRMRSLGIEFTDASSLFGALYALSEQYRMIQERCNMLESSSALKEDGVVAGDVLVEVRVPERHVQPIKDIAEANGTTVPIYLNEQVARALDNLWFF